jgi:hypothetical protein
MGNRGILHSGTDVVAVHRGARWIICALDYKNWRAPQWRPGHYTVLFFHDEAVALAAGHRPCALCRSHAYRAFLDAATLGTDGPPPGAGALDRLLHSQRILPGTHRRRLHTRTWKDLPNGAFVLLDDGPALVLDAAVVPWTETGYQMARQRPVRGDALVITPSASLAALNAGYPVQIDGSAKGLISGEV